MKIFATVLLMIGAASLALAIDTPPVPEINPASGASALALISGALLVFRSARKKREVFQIQRWLIAGELCLNSGESARGESVWLQIQNPN